LQIAFPHNDYAQCRKLLEVHRRKYRRVLVVIEGVYSMDGDIPHLPEFVQLKKDHGAMLFVDEAHSFGTLGKGGRGLLEHWQEQPEGAHITRADIDVTMGTLSKVGRSGSGGGGAVG
jgi:8-amino-7-oxononanoate synthase